MNQANNVLPPLQDKPQGRYPVIRMNNIYIYVQRRTAFHSRCMHLRQKARATLRASAPRAEEAKQPTCTREKTSSDGAVPMTTARLPCAPVTAKNSCISRIPSCRRRRVAVATGATDPKGHIYTAPRGGRETCNQILSRLQVNYK